MQQATARRYDQTPPPPPPPPAPPSSRPDYLRTRRSVEREAEQLESVDQLALAATAGRRTPWVLPPGIERAWSAPVAPRLLLAFLGWLLEGSVRPRWGKGGLIMVDQVTRTVIGSLETRTADGGLEDGAWAELLRCSGRQARRCVRVAEELGLVEQIRNRAPARRERAELAAAYRPTAKLLAWLLERRPPAELQPPETDKMSDPQKFTPSSDVGGDLLRPEGLLTAGQDGRAPDQGSLRSPEAPAELVGDRPPELAFGAVERASAAAPVGDGRPATPLRLVPASVSAWPAAPPANEPPGDYVGPDELAALAARLVGRFERECRPREPTPAELEARRAALRAQLERGKRREALAAWGWIFGPRPIWRGGAS